MLSELLSLTVFLTLKLSLFCKGDNPSLYRENLRTSTCLKSVDLKIKFLRPHSGSHVILKSKESYPAL